MKLSTVFFIASILLLSFIWGFTIFSYSNLPEIVPTHFAVNGTVNGENHKNTIWFLPVIGSFLFLLLAGIPRNPESPMLNVPQSFRNKEKLKVFAYSLLFVILLLLADTVVESILIAQSKLTEMSNAVFFLLVLLFFTIGFHIFKMIKEARRETLNLKN
ncbi:DUF1648 domain-containing protein [Chryseobacterium foetidum]|uniref:DUF1648 domain-containing protein n=1 Tax=Chryseobacterium foetidum TaxID=2951057 RepID=UPI0021C62F54|nr:DUF1648 domain-containing protein [Chryseobacterium foetidum]